MRHDKGFPSKRKSKNERNKNVLQGEGNYEAARNFNEAEQKFVASGRVLPAARAAAPKSVAEQRELLAAERKGKRRARK